MPKLQRPPDLPYEVTDPDLLAVYRTWDRCGGRELERRVQQAIDARNEAVRPKGKAT